MNRTASLRCIFVVLAALPSAWLLGGCASAPVVTLAPVVPYEQKLAWILRLEDHRVLRDPVSATVAAPAPASRVVTAPALPAADLATLLSDIDPRVRRRAALGIGHVGLAAGVPPLVTALAADQEPEVRQMAAFALGLLRSPSAVNPLHSALHDRAPLVQGRSAEALAALGDTASGPAIGEMVSAIVRSGALASIAPDDIAEGHPPAVEAFRLGVLALGRLKAYDALAGAVLGQGGAPVVAWWPVAAAFQRTEDRRAIGPLVAFARGEGSFGRAFAAKGLGALKDAAATDTLLVLAKGWVRDTRAAISAVRAIGVIGDRRAGPALLDLLKTKGLDPLLRLEVIAALGATRAEGAIDQLLDLMSHPSPAVRAAAFRSLRDVDPGNFMLVLSGLDTDREWSVRAALATLMGTLDRDAALPRLSAMLQDTDRRVIPAVLAALVKVRAPDLAPTLLARLKHEDAVVRAAAAAGLGEVRPAGGDRALVDAYHAAAGDTAYGVRTAALDALVKYGPEVARPILREALADKDWAVRLHAADLLKPLEAATDPAAAIRPAPTNQAASFYALPELVAPTVSPRVFIDTERGTIEIEMAVTDAPLTCFNFMALARSGFFKGSTWHRVVPNFVVQDGDPRGDGEGGPGYTIRDEVNERPYVRGTLGMALEWADTGGSQFFLTHSPQPHLDGRYTVFGQVVAGFEVLDRIQPNDTILRVRVWDGKTMGGQ